MTTHNSQQPAPEPDHQAVVDAAAEQWHRENDSKPEQAIEGDTTST